MFEIVIVVTFLVSGSVAEYSSLTRYDTRSECEVALPIAYEQLRLAVLQHVIEKIDVSRECRPAGRGV